MIYPLSQQLVLMCKCKTVTLQPIVNIKTQYFTMTSTAVKVVCSSSYCAIFWTSLQLKAAARSNTILFCLFLFWMHNIRSRLWFTMKSLYVLIKGNGHLAILIVADWGNTAILWKIMKANLSARHLWMLCRWPANATTFPFRRTEKIYTGDLSFTVPSK